MTIVGKAVTALLDNRARSATVYVSPTHIVRATRKLRRGKIPSKRENVDIRLTIGAPNYLEREFVRACKKAGEPFPVAKVQLKFPPKQKKG